MCLTLPFRDIGVQKRSACSQLKDGRVLLRGTHGVTAVSRLVSSAGRICSYWRPSFVGGCRPIELLEFLDQSHWHVEYRNLVIGFGIPSEVLVAQKTRLKTLEERDESRTDHES